MERNTKFVLDGGITYNGVWNATAEQNNYTGNMRGAGITDKEAAPPKGFLIEVLLKDFLNLVFLKLSVIIIFHDLCRFIKHFIMSKAYKRCR